MVVIVTFIACLMVFTVIGLLSIRKKKDDNTDYLLAGRSLSPALAGLSAVATTNSGFMFTGFIGLCYSLGLSSVWFMLGLGSGTIWGLFTANKKLRRVSVQNDALSYGGILSKWHGQNYKRLRFIIGIIILVFLSTYAAAQLTAGSKALQVMFGWQHSAGAIIGAVIILLYCYAGGLRASIWTDVAQSLVMIVAMAMLFTVCLIEIGGFSAVYQQLQNLDPSLVDLTPKTASFGLLMYIAGWFFMGIGIIGQPHIMVRFMGVKNEESMNRSLLYYIMWYVSFFVLTFGVGIMSRILLPEVATFDAELALPNIALDFLPQVLVGLILAGLFAATMSTADSLVLSSSASIMRDVIGKTREKVWFTKLSTVFITVFILAIALWGSKSVFVLVTFGWASLASAFAPLMLVYLLGAKPSENTAIAMVITGTTVAGIWHWNGLNTSIADSLPGMLSAFACFFIGQLYKKVQANKQA